ERAHRPVEIPALDRAGALPAEDRDGEDPALQAALAERLLDPSPRPPPSRGGGVGRLLPLPLREGAGGRGQAHVASYKFGHRRVRYASCSGVSAAGPSATGGGGPERRSGSAQQSTTPRLRVQ